MQHRRFGKTQAQVSRIGFGAWAIGGGWGPSVDTESHRALHRALDLGVNFIDTAQVYGEGHSETLIGEEHLVNDILVTGGFSLFIPFGG